MLRFFFFRDVNVVFFLKYRMYVGYVFEVVIIY